MLSSSREDKKYLQFFQIKSINSYLIYKFHAQFQPTKESNIITIEKNIRNFITLINGL
jgi:hypothetical protein